MAIYKIESKDGRPESWVISSCGNWLPGAYESERAAKYAFKFPDESLARLRDQAIKSDGLIKFTDLQAEAKRRRQAHVSYQSNQLKPDVSQSKDETPLSQLLCNLEVVPLDPPNPDLETILEAYKDEMHRAFGIRLV